MTLALIILRVVLFYLLDYVPQYWRGKILEWKRYEPSHTDATDIVGRWKVGRWKIAELTAQGKPRFRFDKE